MKIQKDLTKGFHLKQLFELVIKRVVKWSTVTLNNIVNKSTYRKELRQQFFLNTLSIGLEKPLYIKSLPKKHFLRILLFFFSMFAFFTVNFNELSENYLTKKEMHSYFIHQVICKYPELLSAAFINLLLKAMTAIH